MKKYVLVFAAVLALLLSYSRGARAQAIDEVSNNGAKGAVGLGLLAGELVVNIEALAGVRKAWIFVVTGLVAAGGGAAGGYFAETKPKADTGAQVGVGLLAGGMAMIVPTLIITTAMTKYRGKKEVAPKVEVESEKAASEMSGEATTEGEVEKPPAEEKPAEEKPAETGTEGAAPSALLNVDKKAVSLAVPPVLMVPVFSSEELGLLTDEQKTEYRINVINFIF
jgi:hypothetical protein